MNHVIKMRLMVREGIRDMVVYIDENRETILAECREDDDLADRTSDELLYAVLATSAKDAMEGWGMMSLLEEMPPSLRTFKELRKVAEDRTRKGNLEARMKGDI